MPILLLSIVFFGSVTFYSEELLAGTPTPQTMEEVEAREVSFMDSLNQVFRLDTEVVEGHDQALQSVVSDMAGCPYTDSIIDQIKNAAMSDCEELIDKARGEQNVSYFLLEKSVEEGDFEEEREQALKGLLQNTRDIILQCQCNEDTFFTLRHKYDTPEEEQSQIGIEECSKRGHTNDSLRVTCQHHESIEQEEKDAITYLQSQLESCTYGSTESEGSDSFSCKALMEEAKKAGLSYYQVRYAVQQTVEKFKSIVSSVEEADQTDEQPKQAQQQKPKP